MALLTCRDLHLKRSDKTILTGVNFTLEAGKLVGLMGANGAGKSTLLKVLAGLLPTASGEIEFEGQSLAKIALRRLACQLAYLPQGHEVHWNMTVENLVILGRLPHLKSWQRPSEKDWRIVYQALHDCDVYAFRHRPVDTLFGGEKARVLLARALAVEPKVLLADEPLAGLDPCHQLEIISFLRKLTQKGMGVVIVIHDLSLAARFCHHIVFLGEQQLLKQGRPDEVMNGDNIARCFKVRALTGVMDDVPFVLPVESLLR